MFELIASAEDARSSVTPSFISDVLNEAKDPSGTWSLATHGRVREAILRLSVPDIEHFLTHVLDRLIMPDLTMRERLKLAQLCKMCYHACTGKVNTIFKKYQEQLLEMASEHSTDSLGPAVSKLVKSLYDGGTFGDRRMSARPQVVTRVAAKIAGKKPALSATPGGATPELE
jgi:hypothetical protein